MATPAIALNHGLDAESPVLPGENADEYRALAGRYQHEFSPRSPSEQFHVDTMIRADWQKRRLQRLETQLYHRLLSESADLAAALLSDSPAAKLLARVQREIAACERSHQRARAELRRDHRESRAAASRLLDRELAHIDAEIAAQTETLNQLASIPQFSPHLPSPAPDTRPPAPDTRPLIQAPPEAARYTST
jgi:hypothetical protein